MVVKKNDILTYLTEHIKLISKLSLHILLFATVLVVPQINISEYPNSTEISKFFILTYSSIIMLAVSIPLILFTKKLKPFRINSFDVTLGLILIYILINKFIIQHQVNYSVRLIELLCLSLFYIILRFLPVKSFMWLLLVVILSGILQGIFGTFQLIDLFPSNHPKYKLTGSFFNPGPFAGFLSVIFSIALGTYLSREKILSNIIGNTKKTKPFSKIFVALFDFIPFLGILIIFVVVLTSQSRASLLALILSSALLLERRFFFFRKMTLNTNKRKFLFLVVSITSVLLTGLIWIYQFKKDSADGRLFIWKITSELIKDNPAFGVGFDNFKAHYMDYQANYFSENGETSDAFVADNTYYAFNEILQFISENGFIGMLLLITLTCIIFKQETKQKYKSLIQILKVSLLTIVVFSLFSYPMQILPIKLVLVLLLAGLANLSITMTTLFKPKSFSFQVLKPIILTLTALITIKSYGFAINLDLDYKKWKYAQERYQYGDYIGATEIYSEIHSSFKQNGEFLMNYGKTLSLSKKHRLAIQTLKEAQQYLNTTVIEIALGNSFKSIHEFENAEKHYLHAHNMTPSKFYPLYLLAKLYHDNGNNIKACEIAKIVLSKRIKVPSKAIDEINMEMKKILKQNE